LQKKSLAGLRLSFVSFSGNKMMPIVAGNSAEKTGVDARTVGNRLAGCCPNGFNGGRRGCSREKERTADVGRGIPEVIRKSR
ncbi:MAG: hypothetical protein ACI4PW_04940, partial [Alphaproteobacteria bacterium]